MIEINGFNFVDGFIHYVIRSTKKTFMFYYGSKVQDYILNCKFSNLHNVLLNLESTPITNDLIN